MLSLRYSYSAIALLISFSHTAYSSNLESDLDKYKSCVDNAISEEKGKDSPTVENILDACQAQWIQVLPSMPSGAEDAVKHQIEHEIAKRLNITSQ